MRRRSRFDLFLGLPLLLIALSALCSTSALALRASTAYWKNPSDRHLHYWIDPARFTPDELGIVRANLQSAASDWEAICPECGIRFIEVTDKADALFSVIEVNTRRAYMAQGFNPSDPRATWALRIDRSYFNDKSQFDKIGVLRHELGHILGYRHEQIAAPAQQAITCGWKTESNLDKVINLTKYDPASLMQYPCGPVTAPVFFTFSSDDIAGHQKLYGPAPRR